MNTPTTPPTLGAPTPMPPPLPPNRKYSTAAMIVSGIAGFMFVLLIGGFALGFYLYTHRSSDGTDTAKNGSDAKTGSSGGQSPNPLTLPPGPGPGLTKGETGVVPSPDLQPKQDPPAGEDPPAAPINPNMPSTLGKEGEPDTLDVPVVLPKGMLSFITGVDLLGAYKPMEAIPYFTKAIEADEENAEYLIARGSAYVVGEKMEQGVPDLLRAQKLDPEKMGPGRMLRLAYLMMGEQQKASKYYLRGSQTTSVDFLIEEVGVGYGSRMLARKGNFRNDPHDEKKAEVAQQKLPLIAKLAADGFRSNDQKSVQAIFALGVEQIRNGEYAAARRGFQDVLVKYPLDMTSRYYYARALMETGDTDLARHELTFVLCWKRFLPEAYAARAICAARQNDVARARADLEIARKLDRAKAAEAEAAVAQSQQMPAPEGAEKDTQRFDALLASAKARPSFQQLVNDAVQLRQCVDARRLRYDETYQTGLYERCAAARAKRGDATKLAEVADYLWDNKDVFGVQMVTNGSVVRFRRQTSESADMEIELVSALVDEGLNFNPKSGYCWAIKSDVLLIKQNKLDEAYAAANNAVTYAPKLPRAYMSLSDCFKEYATRLREQAAAFRSPKSGSRTVVDQHGNYLRSESYSIPPSAADLANAEACDRQAAINEQKEQECFDAAVANAKGTVEEADYKAQIFYLRKDFASARAWLEKALRENPGNYKIYMGLANCLKRMGLTDEYTETHARAINLQETTSVEWLKIAWEKIEKNAWDSARKALLRARELDPSDARILAFWGVLAEFGGKDGTEAEACFRAALAQEEARARSNKSSFLPGPTTSLTQADSGLTIFLRLKAARYMFQRDPAGAAELYVATAEMEKRMSDWSLTDTMKTGMMPNPERDAKEIPQPMPLIAVLKNNRIFAAQALINAGKTAEAYPHIHEADSFINRLPAGGTAYVDLELEPQYVPFRVSSMSIYVKLLNAQILLQQGKKQEATSLLYEVRYYLANQTQAQRAMKDDPIPGMYNRMAPQVGLR